MIHGIRTSSFSCLVEVATGLKRPLSRCNPVPKAAVGRAPRKANASFQTGSAHIRCMLHRATTNLNSENFQKEGGIHRRNSRKKVISARKAALWSELHLVGEWPPRQHGTPPGRNDGRHVRLRGGPRPITGQEKVDAVEQGGSALENLGLWSAGRYRQTRLTGWRGL